MFLSMLVAWMIPDVPRSLREQLKKENMLLMEFLLTQDQEARAKTHSTKPSAPYFPTNIDIVVEAPPENQEEVQVEEEEVVGVEINLDARSRDSDSDPEIGNVLVEGGVNGIEERGDEGEEENREAEGTEKEGEGDVKEEDGKEEGGKEEFEQEESDEKEKGGQRTNEDEAKEVENENFTVDLDVFMSELGLLGKRRQFNNRAQVLLSLFILSVKHIVCIVQFIFFVFCYIDEEPSSGTIKDMELPRSGSKQECQKDAEPLSHSSCKRGSSQSLKISTEGITTTDDETKSFSLIAPPPREPGSKAKARCSTLPSRHRGAEACYSLPRPSHSTSLTRFQQKSTLIPLVSLDPSSSASPSPLSPTHTQASASSTQPLLAQQHKASTELFVLKGPPPQQPRSRAKARCLTLPPRQRAQGPEEHSKKPSHSTSFTKLEDRIPPSPSELKRNRPV